MKSELKSISKFLSMVLRHQPDAIGLNLDPHGWAAIDELIHCAGQHGRRLTLELIEATVAENDKQRFTFNDDRSKIRANQGHSVEIELGLEPQQPPEMLYHGTATRFVESIRQTGLNSGERQHVHMSLDQQNMLAVGSRHGRPVLLSIRSGDMWRVGHLFYCSKNGVWLTDAVPVEYIEFPPE